MSSLPLTGLGRDARRRLLVALLTFALVAGGTVTLDLTPAFAAPSDYTVMVNSARSALEGHAGPHSPSGLQFTITISRTSSVPLHENEQVDFTYRTVGDTAEGGDCAAGKDFLAIPAGTGPSSPVVFTPTNQTSPQTRTVVITVCGDSAKETDEKFSLIVTSGTDAESTGTGTIVNDDPFLTVAPLSGTVADEKKPTEVSYSEGAAGIGLVICHGGTPGATTCDSTIKAAEPIEVPYSITTPVPAPASGRAATTGSSCSTAGVDVVSGGTFTLPAGAISGSLVLPVCPDDRDEFDETFALKLGPIKDGGAFFADGTKEKQYTITLTNDDDPKVIIGDASAPEGSAAMNSANKNNVMTFTLKLDRPSNEEVKVDVKAEAGTAAAGTRTVGGSDFVTLSPSPKNFPIPVNTGTVTVPIELVGDDLTEGDETFMLTAVVTSNEASTVPARKNATVAGAGIGTILDDDKGPPAIGFPTPGTDIAGVESCDDHDQDDAATPSDDVYAVCLDEGQDGQVTKFTFPVVLSHPSQSVVAVEYATADGTSTFNTGDYDVTEGTLQFEPGEIVKTVTVNTNGDAFPGPNEHFFLRLSAPTGGTLRPAAASDPAPTSARGVVLNDDGPVVESEDALASEPEDGKTSKAIFVLSLSETSAQPVTVKYTTVSDTARAGSDFTATQGTATIPAGSLKTEVPVPVLGDDISEGDETFFLQLSDAVGGTLRRAKLTGTIQDAGSTNRARALDLACPSSEVPSAGYSDVTGPTHELAIDCLAWWAITSGRGDGTYDPGGNVTRAQMASFIARAMTAAGVELPTDPPDHFRDDNGSPHELAINQLTELGVVTGKADGSYGATDRVGRGQTASLTARAYEVTTGTKLPAGDDAFRDDNDTTHEDSIDRVAAAGIVTGKADGKFDAGGTTTRAQMASILMRLMDLLVEEEFATTPSSEPEPTEEPTEEPTDDPSDNTSDDTSDDTPTT